MEKFFQNPFKEKLYPEFNIRILNSGNGMTRPALSINWSTGTQIVVKKTLLFENGDLLSEYIESMLKTHPMAFGKLLEFSSKNLEEKYRSIHNLISSKVQLSC